MSQTRALKSALLLAGFCAVSSLCLCIAGTAAFAKAKKTRKNTTNSGDNAQTTAKSSTSPTEPIMVFDPVQTQPRVIGSKTGTVPDAPLLITTNKSNADKLSEQNPILDQATRTPNAGSPSVEAP